MELKLSFILVFRYDLYLPVILVTFQRCEHVTISERFYAFFHATDQPTDVIPYHFWGIIPRMEERIDVIRILRDGGYVSCLGTIFRRRYATQLQS